MLLCHCRSIPIFVVELNLRLSLFGRNPLAASSTIRYAFVITPARVLWSTRDLYRTSRVSSLVGRPQHVFFEAQRNELFTFWLALLRKQAKGVKVWCNRTSSQCESFTSIAAFRCQQALLHASCVLSVVLFLETYQVRSNIFDFVRAYNTCRHL